MYTIDSCCFRFLEYYGSRGGATQSGVHLFADHSVRRVPSRTQRQGEGREGGRREGTEKEWEEECNGWVVVHGGVRLCAGCPPSVPQGRGVGSGTAPRTACPTAASGAMCDDAMEGNGHEMGAADSMMERCSGCNLRMMLASLPTRLSSPSPESGAEEACSQQSSLAFVVESVGR